jgi:hypothetical protein
MTQWFDHLTQNPFFSGGAVLVMLGGLLAYFRHLPWRIWNFLERFFFLKIEVLDDDEAYHWMRVWLAERMSGTLSISVCTRRKKKDDEDEDEDDRPADNRPQVYFVPSPGTYFFLYRGRPVMLTRDRDEQPTAGEGSVARIRECFNVRVLSWDRSLAHELIERCKDAAIPQDGKVDVRVASYNYWELGSRMRPRSLESVVLADGQGEFLRRDMQAFLSGHDWYVRVGIPYRRGYLLYGEPGNGKTSLVKALASELNMNIYVLNLSMPDMSDGRLAALMRQVADNSIVLMEDVDCAFAERERASGGKAATDGMTFSGLLNAIDGVASPEGQIVCMTTNHRERLDPALIRPGRADVQVYIGNAGRDQARRLFRRFHPDAPARLAALFAEAVPDRQYSMAALQGHLQQYRDDPERAVAHLDELLARPALPGPKRENGSADHCLVGCADALSTR